MRQLATRLCRLNGGDWVKAGDVVKATRNTTTGEIATGRVSALFNRPCAGEDDRMARVVFFDGAAFSIQDLQVSAIQTVEVRG